ncbi:MAG: cytochrome c3 family protein [Desulfobulbaceae bacterium]|uniref:Cytochrome c3 family protein n=1 Tax=Candidatus Desulfobia pelagia TaxID=2841692 RepID=A0A8J6TF73_9BACT|nr:cytochrome c3 family protein [Candidatus Desulfobia pelagia]
MKKTLIFATALSFLACAAFTASAIASDKGPADMTLESTIDAASKPKPAVFPHAKHQETLECAECHHGKDADGKQAAYTEGMKVEKCESCHNKAAGMPAKLDTFKAVAHANCKGCHKATGKKELTSCKACHK